jgi:hypothetical protein
MLEKNSVVVVVQKGDRARNDGFAAPKNRQRHALNFLRGIQSTRANQAGAKSAVSVRFQTFSQPATFQRCEKHTRAVMATRRIVLSEKGALEKDDVDFKPKDAGKSDIGPAVPAYVPLEVT